MSKGGVSPRTAQAAMRHSDIRLTMNVYTDPKLLDICGALDTLPTLRLDAANRDDRGSASNACTNACTYSVQSGATEVIPCQNGRERAT